MHTDLAALLGCKVVPTSGTMLTFHGDAAPLPRFAVEEPLVLRYGNQEVRFIPDVAPLATTKWLIVGRPMRSELGIYTGPLETSFPPTGDLDTESEFQDLTDRNRRVLEGPPLSPEDELERADMRAEVMAMLEHNAKSVPLSSHITADAALYRVEHEQDTRPSYVISHGKARFMSSHA